MVKKILDAIINNNLINKGDNVLCAVSGGADSVALLHILNSLKEEIGFDIFAAHFNHKIRGDAADNDEQFVINLCNQLNIKCVIKKCDVPLFARQKGYTLEQAGRILRYDFFKELNPDKIAVAHHMDDQAESVLMHLIRGSGTTGLCGMRYMRGKIIRPMLSIRRSEIEDYLNTQDLSFCTDETNFATDAARNLVRLKLIPQISSTMNSKFVESLCNTAELISRDEDYLNKIAEKELNRITISENCYNRINLAYIDLPILTRALRIACQRAGAFSDIESKHIDILIKFLNAKTGSFINLPHIKVSLSYDKILFSDNKDSFKLLQEDYSTQLIPNMCINTGKFKIYNELISNEAPNILIIKSNKDKNTSYLDYDKLVLENCFIRNRRQGDRIDPIGSSGSKKLKDYFIDKKIERENRDLPLLCSNNEVLCAVGLCVSKKVMITETTERILKISYSTEE